MEHIKSFPFQLNSIHFSRRFQKWSLQVQLISLSQQTATQRQDQ